MAKPVVIVIDNSSLRNFADQIEASINRRFHNYKLYCEEYPESEEEARLRIAITTDAQNVGGNKSSADLYVNGVHREQLLG